MHISSLMRRGLTYSESLFKVTDILELGHYNKNSPDMRYDKFV